MDVGRSLEGPTRIQREAVEKAGGDGGRGRASGCGRILPNKMGMA